MRPEPRPGDTFAGHVIEGEVGRGGMGVVYRARNVALDRIRALKVVAPELSADPAFGARFRREARLAASVEHPNVVTVHHAGDEDGLLYIVMRYVDGVDLSRVLAAGPLSPERAIAILRPVAAALDAAHAAGLVHRDVKPANVLIEAGGAERVYLTDFGISKPLAAAGPGGGTATTALTASGQVLGTADYVSPEAIEGGAVDARSDVYSLACLAYHLFAGRPPFERDRDLATLIAHTKAERPSAAAVNPRLPMAIDGALREGMSIDPERRPASAGELVGRLEAALGSSRSSPSDRLPAKTVVLGIAGLLVVAATIVIATSLLGGDGGDEIPSVTSPVVATGAVGAGPVGVAVGDTRIWVASRDANQVWRLRRDEPVQANEPIDLPEPRSVAIGLGSIWVVNGVSLYRIDPEGGAIPELIAVGEGPGDVAVDSDFVWIANEEDGTVTRVEPGPPGSEPETTTIAVGEEPRSIATGRGSVWVAVTGEGAVKEIDSANAEVTDSVRVGSQPTSLAVGADSVWVADNEESRLYRFDRRSGEIAGTPIEVAQAPRGVAVGLGAVWVCSGAESIVERFDPDTGDPIGSAIEVGADPADITTGEAAAYTANFGDASVTRIDP